MKSFEKILSLLLIVMGTALFSACSDDKDESKISIPTAKYISVGTSFSLGLSDNWHSSNDFVASVDKNGNVNAEHVGVCTISNGRKRCKVTVTPNSNFIKEPIKDWGISKELLISKCGSDYKVSGNAIGYKSDSDIAPIIMYTFDNNGLLSSSVITVKTAYTSDLVNFLIERYQPIAADGYDFFFANGYTTQTTSTVIGMSLYKYNNDYWMVIYMPYGNSSRCSEEIDLSNNLFSLFKE